MILGRRERGFTLIELLIAMVVAAIIIAGVYRIFNVQQKTFVVQEEVAEAQQNARAVMDLVARDIRMAGFGMPAWDVGVFSEPITITSASEFTLLGAFDKPAARLASPVTLGDTQLVLDRSDQTFFEDNTLLILERHYDDDPSGDPLAAPIPQIRYANVAVFADADEVATIEIDAEYSGGGDTDQNGLEVNLRADGEGDANRKVYTEVYRVPSVTYRFDGDTLWRDGDILATNVQAFQIVDNDNGSYALSLTMETEVNDPNFPDNAGRRTRALTTTIQARNIRPTS
jgi:prepilin-type N-terminal cleavage/methylation domain-containing protein